jgi:hypothetical protein
MKVTRSLATAFIPVQVNAMAKLDAQPIVLTSQNGLQLQLDLVCLQNPNLIALVKELLCGR